ncbi:MAG: hypothetical protein ACJAW8_001199 [Oleispira sp.]|jgi:hypothetical protein
MLKSFATKLLNVKLSIANVFTTFAYLKYVYLSWTYLNIALIDSSLLTRRIDSANRPAIVN